MVLGPEDGRGAERDRRADHRAEVLRIFDLVERHDHVRIVGRGVYGTDQVVDREDGEIGGVGERALMAASLRRPIQLSSRDSIDVGDAAIASEPRHGLDLGPALVLHEDAFKA